MSDRTRSAERHGFSRRRRDAAGNGQGPPRTVLHWTQDLDRPEDDLQALIGLLYDAALDATLWPIFLRRLAQAAGAADACYFARDTPRDTLGPDVDVTVSARADAAPIDPHTGLPNRGLDREPDAWLDAARLGLDETAAANGTPAETDRTAGGETCTGFRCLDGAFGLLGVARGAGTLRAAIGVCRGAGAAPFGAPERDLVGRLLPHLKRVGQWHGRVAVLEARQSAQSVALDRLPIGVLLVDARGKVVEMNRAAREIARENDGLLLEKSRPGRPVTRETDALQGLIREALRAGANDGAPTNGVMLLSRPSLRRPIAVMVVPVDAAGPGRPHAPLASEARNAAAVVFLCDPERRHDAPAQLLARLYGLTPAEARLVRGLADGRRLDELAEAFGISKETARTQLRHIYPKTGTNRQAELVRLVLTGPAQLFPERSDE